MELQAELQIPSWDIFSERTSEFQFWNQRGKKTSASTSTRAATSNTATFTLQ